MSTYLGFPLFLERPNWISEPRTDFVNAPEIFKLFGAADFGAIQPETRTGFQAEFLRKNKTEIASMWDFVDARLAKLHGFWIPSWQRDIVLTAPVGVTDTTISIEDVEYSAHWFPNEIVGRHLYIEWPDKTYVIRKVVEVPTSTSLHFDDPVGKAGENLFISFLLFARLDLDQVCCDYHSDEVGTFELSFQAIPMDTFPEVPAFVEWETTLCPPPPGPVWIDVTPYWTPIYGTWDGSKWISENPEEMGGYSFIALLPSGSWSTEFYPTKVRLTWSGGGGSVDRYVYAGVALIVTVPSGQEQSFVEQGYEVTFLQVSGGEVPIYLTKVEFYGMV